MKETLKKLHLPMQTIDVKGHDWMIVGLVSYRVLLLVVLSRLFSMFFPSMKYQIVGERDSLRDFQEPKQSCLLVLDICSILYKSYISVMHLLEQQ